MDGVKRGASIGLLGLAGLGFGCGGEGAGPGAVVDPPTYYEDIKPLVDAKCGNCHRDGGIAPFSLETYEQAKTWAAPSKTAVSNRTMPPWLADNGCNSYKGDRSLSDEQIAAFTAWVDGGALEGDPAHAGEPLPGGQQFPSVDVSLPLPLEYTPLSEPDDYRCFVLDWAEDTVKYVSAFRATPGEARVVHHVIAFIAPPDQAAEAVALDTADPAPGYPCFGGPGLSGRPQWLGAWVPGDPGKVAPPGTGVRVDPGSKIIVQMHYNTLTAGKLPDRTTLDLALTTSVEKEALVMPWANPSWLKGNMPIPAFEEDVMHTFSFDPTVFFSDGKPIRFHGAALHMHTLGTRGRLSILRSDGSGSEACLLDVPRWDFDWQGMYDLAEPVDLMPGDRLTLECHWDNSPPNQPIIDGKPKMPTDVNWGEGTTDEMCLGVFYTTPAP